MEYKRHDASICVDSFAQVGLRTFTEYNPGFRLVPKTNTVANNYFGCNDFTKKYLLIIGPII